MRHQTFTQHEATAQQQLLTTHRLGPEKEESNTCFTKTNESLTLKMTKMTRFTCFSCSSKIPYFIIHNSLKTQPRLTQIQTENKETLPMWRNYPLVCPTSQQSASGAIRSVTLGFHSNSGAQSSADLFNSYDVPDLLFNTLFCPCMATK